MQENLNINTSNSLNPPNSIFPNLSIPISPSFSSYRSESKPQLTPVQSKIIDDQINDDIKVEIENSMTEEYFRPDPVEEQEKSIDSLTKIHHSKKEDSAHESYFKPGVFFKFLIMHLIFFCALGPFIILLTPIFGWHTLRNQGFIGCRSPFWTQCFQYFFIIAFLSVLYLTETPGLQGIEVYMVLVSVVIRMITISSKYAHQSEWWLNQMKIRTFTEKDRTNDLMILRWRTQTDDVIEEEIQAAILRLEIDSPFFFFDFLCEIEPKLRHRLLKKTKTGHAVTLPPPLTHDHGEESIIPLTQPNKKDTSPPKMKNIINKHHEKIIEMQAVSRIKGNRSGTESPLVSPKSEVLVNMTTENKDPAYNKLGHHTQKIMEAFLDFLKPQKLEDKYLYGYNFMYDLLVNARKYQMKYVPLIALLISVTRAMIPTLYRVYLIEVEGQDIEVFTDKPYLVAIIFLVNVMFFWINCIILIIPLLNVTTKVYCFKQIGYLISPRKIHYFKEKKLYPTLNIFDPVTLKTWSNIRKIMRDYGRKYDQRNSLNIGLTMAFYSIILATFLLQMLGIFTAFADPLVLIIFGLESFTSFVVFLTIMIRSAFLNNQYKVHKNLLKKNKTVISDFHRLSHLYVGKDPIQSGSYLYKEGMRILKRELGEEDFESKLVERTDKLIGMIDDIIEELEFEESNEPFTVMGVVIDYNLLKSFLLGGVSLVFAMGQTYINQ